MIDVTILVHGVLVCLPVFVEESFPRRWKWQLHCDEPFFACQNPEPPALEFTFVRVEPHGCKAVGLHEQCCTCKSSGICMCGESAHLGPWLFGIEADPNR